jgi:hypothetical protein
MFIAYFLFEGYSEFCLVYVDLKSSTHHTAYAGPYGGQEAVEPDSVDWNPYLPGFTRGLPKREWAAPAVPIAG